MNVYRWGRSAYETDADLDRERADAVTLGFAWAHGLTPAPAEVWVVTSGVRVDAARLAAHRPRLVLTTTSGFDHIDLAAAAALDVTVARCPLARRDAVVEQAVAQVMGLMRCFPALDAAARQGRWARAELPGLAPRLVRGARVLVVGCGVIGARVGEVFTALGAEVWGCDPRGVPEGLRAVTLDEALPEVDAVTLHCSLSATSEGLLDAARIDRLRPHAVLVNTARGRVLDVSAAVERVRCGRLRGLAVDVFPEEPWPDLAVGVPGVWFTPHSAGASHDLGARVAAEVQSALSAWQAGAPVPHRVCGPERRQP